MMPRTKELPHGFEVDILARDIHHCSDWSITVPQTEAKPEPSWSLASRVLETRVRLAQLSGWPSDSALVVDQLRQAVEAVMNHIYQPEGNLEIKQESKHQATLEWKLGVNTRTYDGKLSYHSLITTLTRSKSDDKWTPWRARYEDIEAALSLWLLHFWRPDFAGSRNLWIISPDSPTNRITYDWWIFRGTDRISIGNVEETCNQKRVSEHRVFDALDWQRRTLAEKHEREGRGLIGTATSDNLPVACSHFLLQCFLRNAIAGVEKLNGKMGISRGATPGQFLLVHESVRGIAEALQQTGLVSIENSYKLVVPTLSDAGILPEPFDMLEEIVGVASAQADSGTPGPDDTFERLIHLCQNRAKAWSLRERWAEAGKAFLRII